MTRFPRRSAVAIAVGAGALFLAACGTVGYSEGRGDKMHGKELFTEKCGSCHVLADAGTKGQVGPDLDYAFLQSRRDGLGEDTITQVVRQQIAYPVEDPPSGQPGMPKDIVTGEDAEDVASYVASVAGVGSTPATTPTPTPSPGTTKKPPAGGDSAAEGKEIFASAGCVSCHTLKDAGATGTVGPNLDEAMPDEALVVDRVTNGRGGMPAFKDQLSADQIKAVAEYVSSVASS